MVIISIILALSVAMQAYFIWFVLGVLKNYKANIESLELNKNRLYDLSKRSSDTLAKLTDTTARAIRDIKKQLKT